MGGGPIGSTVGAVAGAVLGGLAANETVEALKAARSRGEGRYLNYTVLDQMNKKVGKIEAVWLTPDDRPLYLGVQTGWLPRERIHLVPAEGAKISDTELQIRLPYTAEHITTSPDFNAAADLRHEDEQQIGSFYSANSSITNTRPRNHADTDTPRELSRK